MENGQKTRNVIVSKTFSFDAAHVLPWHTGKCKFLHGHTFNLEIKLIGPLNENGIVMDFKEIKALINDEFIEKYDHSYLNDFFENPTAEHIALHIFETLNEKYDIDVYGVKVWETPTSYAEVRK